MCSMVKQTRHIFDLSDVKAIRFQCANPNCKGEVVQSMLKYKMPDDCPLCGAGWTDNADGAMGPNRLLARSIQDVLRSDNLPMTVRFEINGDED